MMEEKRTFVIEYTMTKSELLEFCRYIQGRAHKNARNGCIFTMVIFIGMFVLSMFQGLEKAQLPWLVCGILAPAVYVLFHTVSVRRSFKRLENSSFMKKQWLAASEGYIYFSQTGKMSECVRYHQEKGTGQLIIYAEDLPDGRRAYGAVPKRAFGSPEEMEAFTEEMKNSCDEGLRDAKQQEFDQIKQSYDRENSVSKEEKREIRNPKGFWFFVPPEMLPAVYVELNQILFLFRKKSRKRRVWSIIMILIMTAGLCFFYKFTMAVTLVMLTAATSLWFFTSRSVFGSGQLKMYDRQVRYGLIPQNLLGNWNIWIGEDGYRTVRNDVSKNILCTEKRHVVQTESAYFILDEQMDQSDLFLKTMFTDESQKIEWERRCQEWGWPVETLDRKRIRRNINGRWAALAISILAGFAAVFLTVFEAVQDFKELYLSGSPEYAAVAEEEHIYVPIETQVKVLREPGFHVSDEIAGKYREQLKKEDEFAE